MNGEEEKWQELFTKMDELVRAEQLHLQSNLKLEDLARRLRTNTRYASQAVNRISGQSFTQYINQIRINVFKEKLTSPEHQHLTIDALAAESGFQSSSTLHRIFKQEEGMSPSAYRRKIEKSGMA